MSGAVVARVGGPLAIAMVLLCASTVAGAERPPLERPADVLERLSRGEIESIVSMFRYFEDVIGAAEAGRERQAMKTFVTLIVSRLGRVDRWEPTTTTDTSFVNAFMEAATPDLWRNSDCLFKSYAFKARFVKDGRHRAGEVWLDVCVDTALRPRWLRKIDVHLVRPEQEAVNTMQALFNELRQGLEKLRAPRT